MVTRSSTACRRLRLELTRFRPAAPWPRRAEDRQHYLLDGRSHDADGFPHGFRTGVTFANAAKHGRRSAALLSSVEDHDVLDEYQSHGCAVLDKCAGVSRHVPPHGADGPAMRHGDHCLPGVCPCDALDRGDDTICELLARLA